MNPDPDTVVLPTTGFDCVSSADPGNNSSEDTMSTGVMFSSNRLGDTVDPLARGVVEVVMGRGGVAVAMGVAVVGVPSELSYGEKLWMRERMVEGEGSFLRGRFALPGPRYGGVLNWGVKWGRETGGK